MNKGKDGRRRTTIRLRPDLKRKLLIKASDEKRSMGAHVLYLIKEYASKKRPPGYDFDTTYSDQLNIEITEYENLLIKEVCKLTHKSKNRLINELIDKDTRHINDEYLDCQPSDIVS